MEIVLSIVLVTLLVIVWPWYLTRKTIKDVWANEADAEIARLKKALNELEKSDEETPL